MGFFNGEPLESQGSFTSRFFFQLIIILGLPRLVYIPLQKLLQPRVVSEIIAGIFLGPTFLGKIPGFTDTFFPPRSVPFLASLAQFGMVMYMFMVGISLSVDQIIEYRKITIGAVILGNGLPFVAAIGLSFLFGERYMTASRIEVIIILAALMITSALAVLARILGERNMLQSNLGAVAMATTAADTFLAWLMLSACLSLYGARMSSKDGYSPSPTPSPSPNSLPACPTLPTPPPPTFDSTSTAVPFLIFGACLILVCLIVFPARPIMEYISNRVTRKGRLEMVSFVCSVIIVMIFSYVAQTLTVSGMLGAFAFGLIGVPRKGTYIQEMRRTLEGLVTGIFLPIFFAVSGLRTNWFNMNGQDVGLAFLLVACTWLTKFVGCVGAACMLGLEGYKSLYLGVLLTGKGLTILAMLNICLDVDFVTPVMFSLGVLFVVLSIILVTPIVALLQWLERPKKAAVEQKDTEAVKPKPTTTNVVLYPSALYYAEAIGVFGTWTAEYLQQPSYTAIRIDCDESDMAAVQHLIQNGDRSSNRDGDVALEPLFRIWAKSHWRGEPYPLRSRVIHLRFPEWFDNFLNGENEDNEDYQVVVFGHDYTYECQALLNAALLNETRTVVVVCGVPYNISLMYMSRVLVVGGFSTNIGKDSFLYTKGLQHLYPKCQYFWWVPEGGEFPHQQLGEKYSIDAEEYKCRHVNVEDLMRSFSVHTAVREDFPISAIFIPIDTHHLQRMMDIVQESRVPVIFIRTAGAPPPEPVPIPIPKSGPSDAYARLNEEADSYSLVVEEGGFGKEPNTIEMDSIGEEGSQRYLLRDESKSDERE